MFTHLLPSEIAVGFAGFLGFVGAVISTYLVVRPTTRPTTISGSNRHHLAPYLPSTQQVLYPDPEYQTCELCGVRYRGAHGFSIGPGNGKAHGPKCVGQIKEGL